DVALAGRLAALDDADDASAAETRRDLVAAEFPQPVRHECRSAVYVVEQFRMFVDIPAPGLNIGLQIGDAVDDGHGNFSAFLGLSTQAMSSTHPRSAQHSSGDRRQVSRPSATKSDIESRKNKRGPGIKSGMTTINR